MSHFGWSAEHLRRFQRMELVWSVEYGTEGKCRYFPYMYSLVTPTTYIFFTQQRAHSILRLHYASRGR